MNKLDLKPRPYNYTAALGFTSAEKHYFESLRAAEKCKNRKWSKQEKELIKKLIS